MANTAGWMPVAVSYPGVYIEEIPSGVRTITGVATSITAFIGRALRGPTDEPVTINSNADFERTFGGLWIESSLGFAVRDFISTAVVRRSSCVCFIQSLRRRTSGNSAECSHGGRWHAATGVDAAAAAANAANTAVTYTDEPGRTAAASCL